MQMHRAGHPRTAEYQELHWDLKDDCRDVYCVVSDYNNYEGFSFRLLFRTTKQELKRKRKMIECNTVRWKLFDLRTVSKRTSCRRCTGKDRESASAIETEVNRRRETGLDVWNRTRHAFMTDCIVHQWLYIYKPKSCAGYLDPLCNVLAILHGYMYSTGHGKTQRIPVAHNSIQCNVGTVYCQGLRETKY